MIKRYIKKDIINHLNAKEITLLTGPRQVGKTTLLKEIISELKANDKKVVFFNLDIDSDAKHFETQDLLLKKTSLEIGDEDGYIFIDEIQRKPNAGIFLKGLYDKNIPYKLVATGSGSLELKEKIHESLLGRKRLFEMMPVTFMEFADYKTNYHYSGQLIDFFKLELQQAENLLNEYLNFGGYPRIVTESKADERLKIIDEIFRSYVEKDLVYLMNIERPDAFNMLLQLISSQVGQIINYNQLATQLNLSLKSLKKYLWYAEKTFSLQRITPYSTNLNKEITKAPQYYFTDIGLRNHAVGMMGNVQMGNQIGYVFQNLVYNTLKEYVAWKGWSIHFWRTTDKAEVDFIINKKYKVLPVEVKFGKISSPTISRSFRSFLNKYHPPEAWLISPYYENEITINDTVVKFLPFYKVYEKE